MPRCLTNYLLVSAACALPLAALAQPACNCGPTYCVDTPQYRTELAKKKKAAAKHPYPARLVTLYDKLDHCEAGITRSPDGFNIFRHQGGNSTIDAWSAENEAIGAKAVAKGELEACYVILSRKAFACCGAKPAEERSDYNKKYDLNMTATLPCNADAEKEATRTAATRQRR